MFFHFTFIFIAFHWILLSSYFTSTSQPCVLSKIFINVTQKEETYIIFRWLYSSPYFLMPLPFMLHPIYISSVPQSKLGLMQFIHNPCISCFLSSLCMSLCLYLTWKDGTAFTENGPVIPFQFIPFCTSVHLILSIFILLFNTFLTIKCMVFCYHPSNTNNSSLFTQEIYRQWYMS